MHRILFLAAAVALLVVTAGCLQSGVARLPQRSDLLITTGDVEWNYESLGFIEVQQVRCAPCSNLEASYEHLSETIKEDFRKHAKDLGATAVINVHYQTMHGGPVAMQVCVSGPTFFDFVKVVGTAVKPTGAGASVVPEDLPATPTPAS